MGAKYKKNYFPITGAFYITFIVSLIVGGGLCFSRLIEVGLEVGYKQVSLHPILNDFTPVLCLLGLGIIFIFSFVMINYLEFDCENGVFSLPYEKGSDYKNKLL